MSDPTQEQVSESRVMFEGAIEDARNVVHHFEYWLRTTSGVSTGVVGALALAVGVEQLLRPGFFNRLAGATSLAVGAVALRHTELRISDAVNERASEISHDLGSILPFIEKRPVIFEPEVATQL